MNNDVNKRSDCEHYLPSPSDQLKGICHGIINGGVDCSTAFGAIKAWMIGHLSEVELARMEKTDPSWDFESETSDKSCESFLLLTEYGLRVKDGKSLPPLPRDGCSDMRYSQVKSEAKIDEDIN